jgi:hypothetical protein
MIILEISWCLIEKGCDICTKDYRVHVFSPLAVKISLKPNYSISTMESFVGLSLISVAIYNIPFLPWSSVFALRPCGLRLYTFRDPARCALIQKKIQDRSSVTTDDGKSIGYSFGFWYFLHINEVAWILGTRGSVERLLRDDDDAPVVVV